MSDFVLVSVVEYEDDTCDVMELHRGPREDCESVCNRIDVVSVDSVKPVREALTSIVPADEYDVKLQKAIDDGEAKR